jgi:two-component system chemotaxis sensor kinase CheA
MRSKKLLRQIKKNFQSEDFEGEVKSAVEILQGGGLLPNAPTFFENLLALPHFLDTIDNSYTQNETMLELANRSLEVSTKELYQANEQFRLLNQAISAMVNSLDEGFLVIDKSGRCGNVISNAAIKFLAREPKGEALTEILNIKPEERESFNEWMQMLFNEVIPFDDLIELAPKQLDLEGSQQKIEIKLKPIRSPEDKTITDIVVILIDISEKAEAERKLGEQKLFTDMVIKYLNNKTNFIRIIQLTRETADSMRSWVPNEAAWNETLESLSRELHTLKGGVNTFSMYQLGYKIHQIEDEILTFCAMNTNLQENTELIRALGQDLLDTLFEFLEKNKRIFNFNDKTAQPLKEVPTNNIYKFCAELLKIGLTDLLKYYVDEIVVVPFISMFAPVEANIYTQSINMGKQVDLTFQDPKLVKVIPEFYNALFEQLVHIFNNILDHALEVPEERIAYGKDPTGKIVVKVDIVDNNTLFDISTLPASYKNTFKNINANYSTKIKGWLHLYISDDGKGINPEIIRKKLDQKNINHTDESDEQVIYHIFDQGFSTNETTTITSGRGVGMTAVLKTVETMGGQLTISSAVGKGTTFSIRVPYIKEIDQGMVEWMTNSASSPSLAS